jgi:hypothetical protein
MTVGPTMQNDDPKTHGHNMRRFLLRYSPGLPQLVGLKVVVIIFFMTQAGAFRWS